MKKQGAQVVLPIPDGWPPSSGPKSHAASGILGDELSEDGKRFAIVIGISNYPGSAYDIFYADDAWAMYGMLTTVYNFDEVIPLIDMDATHNGILENAIPYLKAMVGEEDELVFYFSGHGAKRNGGLSSQGVGKVGMVVWNDDESDIEEALDFIWDDELKAAFSGFATDRIVFVFDMCLAGGMIDVASQGNVVCMATTQNGTAYEYGPAYYDEFYVPGYDDVSNGVFTALFALAGMYDGAADMMLPDGDVTVEEAFDFARFSLEALSSGGLFYQIPTIRDRFENDLPL